MSITSYSELQTAVGNWLHRSDLSALIQEFIALAEAKLKRHPAVAYERKGQLSVSSETTTITTALTDFRELLDLYHDSATARGPVRIVSLSELAELKALFGSTGVPKYAAVTNDGIDLVLAPVPDGTYTLLLNYLAALGALSASNTSNWLLTEHPDIYLYASLVEAEPYVMHDERLMVWKTKLDEALEELQRFQDRKRWANTMIARPKRALGE